MPAITAPVAPVDQPLNCLPAGAVKPFAGSVYAPAGTPVTSAIVPVPPFALNLTVYVVTGTTTETVPACVVRATLSSLRFTASATRKSIV